MGQYFILASNECIAVAVFGTFWAHFFARIRAESVVCVSPHQRPPPTTVPFDPMTAVDVRATGKTAQTASQNAKMSS